jgi:hypothetical protein
MAFGNWRNYPRGREEVSLKKYLYVFRPLLACRWIERERRQVPILRSRLMSEYPAGLYFSVPAGPVL